MADDEQIQLEEIESLKAIYDSDFEYLNRTSFAIKVKSINSINDETEDQATITVGDILELQIMLPIDYPTHSQPIFSTKCTLLSDEEHKELEEQFNKAFNIGEVVIYQWVELAREYLDHKMEERQKANKLKETETMRSEDDACLLEVESLEEKVKEIPSSSMSPPSGPSLPSSTPVIFHGEPLTDRKSTFQAHLAEVQSQAEVQMALTKLKENRKIATATHNILAYRFLKDGVQVQDCDDDGESAAGSRLLHLLQITTAQNVLVVVSRWYGGIHLGPDRFKHINNVARMLLQTTGLIMNQQADNNKKKIKAKKRN